MKHYLIVVIALAFFLSACGGSLSKEQREEMKEARKHQEILHITDADILDMALKSGREVTEVASKVKERNGSIDSLESLTKARIKWLVPGQSDPMQIEQQLIDAYITGMASGSTPENTQLFDSDSVLYTMPVAHEAEDGTMVIEGIWSIHFSKRELILAHE